MTVDGACGSEAQVTVTVPDRAVFARCGKREYVYVAGDDAATRTTAGLFASKLLSEQGFRMAQVTGDGPRGWTLIRAEARY